jgi:hypothetical protein
MMLLLPLAALCVPASAQDAAPAPGMVVVRDAQTGQLRTPTPAEMRALQPAPSASMRAQAQPSMVTGPGGRRSVRLGERHMVYSVVKRDAEGKLGEQCVHGVHAAERAAQGAAEPAPAKQEEHRHEGH